jgi:uncharacterized protein (TIGR03067 family)
MLRLAIFWVYMVTMTVGVGAQEKKEEKKDVPKELAPFQGTWKIVGGEVDGKPAPLEEAAGVRFVFEGNKLYIKEPKGKETVVHSGTISVDPTKEPAEMDTMSEDKDDDPVKARGIYKFDKDGRLHMCDVKGRPGRPKTFNTKDTPRSILIVLEKVKE